MRKPHPAAVAALLILASAPSFAGTRSCTTSMVSTLNICRATTDVAYCLPLSTIDPDNGGPKLAPSILARDAIADNNGWQATMTCTQLMVDAGICNAGQLGTSVSVSKAQFADMMIRRYVMEQIKAYRSKQEHAAAQTTVDTETPPDVGN